MEFHVRVPSSRNELAPEWLSRSQSLVLDLSMPLMNGLDAARRIAVISPTTGMVLFTAHASKQLEIEAKRAGVRAVLAKDDNASLEQLTATLQQITSTGRAA